MVVGRVMGSLNPRWLTIELESIDATVENWNAAIRTSYEAALQSLILKNLQDDRVDPFNFYNLEVGLR
jgi:hypothetical protein